MLPVITHACPDHFRCGNLAERYLIMHLRLTGVKVYATRHHTIASSIHPLLGCSIVNRVFKVDALLLDLLLLLKFLVNLLGKLEVKFRTISHYRTFGKL